MLKISVTTQLALRNRREVRDQLKSDPGWTHKTHFPVSRPDHLKLQLQQKVAGFQKYSTQTLKKYEESEWENATLLKYQSKNFALTST